MNEEEVVGCMSTYSLVQLSLQQVFGKTVSSIVVTSPSLNPDPIRIELDRGGWHMPYMVSHCRFTAIRIHNRGAYVQSYVIIYQDVLGYFSEGKKYIFQG